MPDGARLNTVSYVVLGLVAARQPITSYEMKQTVAQSIGHFWPFPHSQLYAEPVRLVGLGHLDEEIERTGRKRRRYCITPVGEQALSRWLADPSTAPVEIRDLAMLKLFFGAHARPEDLAALAAEQQRFHEERLGLYQSLREVFVTPASPWPPATLDVALRYEQMAADFWAEVADRARRAATI